MKYTTKRIRSAKRIIVINLILFVLIVCMFLMVKCRKHDVFSYKEDYKSISLEGKWYMVDNSDVYIVRMEDGQYVERDVNNNLIKKGTFEIGDHAIRLDGNVYSMEYTDEYLEAEYLADTDKLKDYNLSKYFVVKKGDQEVYYYSKKEAAEDKLSDNFYTNEYFEEAGIVDDYGYAIDGDDCLVAYVGNNDTINVGGEVTSIGENAFATDYDRAKKLKKVFVSSTVEKIDSYAFAFSNVEEVHIDGAVKTIEENAFCDSTIKHIYLPENVTEWKGNIFGNLEDVTIHVKQNSRAEEYVKSLGQGTKYKIEYAN